MLELKTGNLLEEQAEALVNTVNCVGVMGKGIALQFKQAFPENFRRYKKACDAGEVRPGQMFTVPTGTLLKPKYIINFPTKRHWRGKSKIEDIRSGLDALVAEVQRLKIQSIAIPPLGCGNGGLDWTVVKPLIINALTRVPNLELILFEPGGAPSPDKLRVSTKVPPMTRPRALVIKLIELYGIPGYRLTKLEIQKLAYFLQEAGETGLKLNYVKHKFGPYAENLNFPLQRLEGHYIRGYGDRTQTSQIYVLPEGQQSAESFLSEHPDALEKLNQVGQLIWGFETPYGMELLATIHWAAKDNPKVRSDLETAISSVHSWNERKRKIFKPQHIKKAWEHLRDQNWLN